jgi:hypothetical protein
MILVSVDKVIIDFCDIRQSDFIKFYILMWKDFCSNSFKTNKPNGYLYPFSLYHNEDCMFFSYANYKEKEFKKGFPHKPTYTLRLETSPINLIKHKNVIGKIKAMCGDIHFVSADVAYDIPFPLHTVFVMSNDNRRKIYIPHELTTRYFGEGTQRKQNGYCRIYDKAAQLREQKNYRIDGDLSRIEIVYKPESRISFNEVAKHPPKQNKDYFAKIIDDLTWCKPKRRLEIINMQLRDGKYSQYLRREIKNTLTNQVDINFNQLASDEWANIMDAPASALFK